MRSEKEMMELILTVASRDERIRAVYMNGSRTNPNVEKDDYRDFDVVFVVTETLPFVNDPGFPLLFGEPAIIQEPDRNDFFGDGHMSPELSYTWLMLFKDGNRIDLHIQIPELMEKEYGTDSLTVALLDKDGMLRPLPPSCDESYHITKPSEGRFHGVANEFWWCLNNVGKGLVRDQLPYTMWMLHSIVYPMLMEMTQWYIASQYDFKITTGSHGKYFKKYLPKELYEMYEGIYSDGEREHIWNAVSTACRLFGIIGRETAMRLGYTYKEDEEEGMTAYLGALRGAKQG